MKVSENTDLNILADEILEVYPNSQRLEDKRVNSLAFSVPD